MRLAATSCARIVRAGSRAPALPMVVKLVEIAPVERIPYLSMDASLSMHAFAGLTSIWIASR